MLVFMYVFGKYDSCNDVCLIEYYLFELYMFLGIVSERLRKISATKFVYIL